ncbi:hypothetical protein E2542_SST21903 [Spatholobus suberectus]|nr:hypothetical protein E2542_SST21903 [Spatholobus suberectus]
MVPSARTTASRKKKRTRGKPARSHFKKQHQESRNFKQEASSTASCSSKKRDMDSDVAVCSTPKGQKFRIPEVSTCPRAPKKPRVLSNCSLRRSPLTFFAPPDLEVFFCVALRDLPVSFVC